MKKKFLTAEWRKLVLVNYKVDPNILLKYLPKHTELDLWRNDCYVSLVGFMFVNTRVKGCKLPNHINFEEVNLRFYVKHENNDEVKRGVVFIKEIVPKSIITRVANAVYKEHYQTCEMQHDWESSNDNLQVSYEWKNQGNWNGIKVEASPAASPFEKGSEADFITEHYWGYTKVSDTKTNEYQVAHPTWKTYDIIDSDVKVDFESNYGKDFSLLNNQAPHSILLAEGSEISVHNKTTISL